MSLLCTRYVIAPRWLPSGSTWLSILLKVKDIMAYKDLNNSELSLSDGSSFNCWKPFVDKINMLRNKDWMIEIRDIPREENRVADLLAKLALDIPFGEQVMEEAPDVCNFALYRDWEGCDLPLSFAC
ncbi:hypothetical protein G2W53_032602 [Senna tora]|uniref:RNase H type-1 domain-containing protein n=1 Tax=Senna tora TaxID=362788 RepID=A0A834WAC9_9FABA|nr:hypothetical protein G2W53_032602 [Senna tora]